MAAQPLRIVSIHGLIALSYLIWQKKSPEADPAAATEEAARPSQKTLS